MQVNSTVPMNFKSSTELFGKPVIDVDFREVIDQTDYDTYEKTVEKAAQNVHPATVFVSLAVMLTAALKGKKVVEYGRKALITAGEYLAKGVTGGASLFLNKIKKTNWAKQAGNAKEYIAQKADKLRDNDCVSNEKMLNGISDLVEKLSNKEKADSVRAFLEKNNLKNPIRLFDMAVAAVFGIGAIDGVSDGVEQTLDKYDIKKAKENSNAAQAVTELISELVS